MSRHRRSRKTEAALKLLAAMTTMKITFASHGDAKSVEEAFRIEARVLPEEAAIIEMNICYEGQAEKEIRGPLSGDLRIVAAGNWRATPPSSSVIVAGVGPLVVEHVKAGKCLTGFFDLKDLFASISAGKNTVTFELSLTILSDNKTVKLRKTVELEISAEQAKRFAEQATSQK